MLCFQSCLKVYQLLSLRTPRGSQRLITVAIKTTMNLRCFTKWLLLKSVDVSRKEHKTFLKLIDQWFVSNFLPTLFYFLGIFTFAAAMLKILWNKTRSELSSDLSLSFLKYALKWSALTSSCECWLPNYASREKLESCAKLRGCRCVNSISHMQWVIGRILLKLVKTDEFVLCKFPSNIIHCPLVLPYL